jgi:hypothetical protein
LVPRIAKSADSISETTNSLFRRGCDQVKEAYILFPLLAVLLLLVIWTTTLYLINKERSDAQLRSQTLEQELQTPRHDAEHAPRQQESYLRSVEERSYGEVDRARERVKASRHNSNKRTSNCSDGSNSWK